VPEEAGASSGDGAAHERGGGGRFRGLRPPGVRALLALALVGVGLLQAVGTLAGLPAATRLGQSLVASPLPLVFGQRGGLELTARRFELELVTAAGERLGRRGDRQLATDLRGPYTRRKSYITFVTYWNLLPRERVERVLRHAFCEPGRVAEELGASGEVARFTITTWSARSGDEPSDTLRLACPP